MCEGYFDALAIGRGAAAVFGSTLTDQQVRQILSLKCERVVVCYDSDQAGRSGAIKTCRRLRPHIDVRVVLPRLPGDPGSLGDSVLGYIERFSRPFDTSSELELLGVA